MTYLIYFRTVFAGLLLVVALPGFSQTPAASAGITPPTPTAEPPAKETLLLSFISYNTVESKMMHDQLAGDPGVKELIEKQYVLTTYVEGRDTLPIACYQVTRYPTLIATQADGTEIDRIVGYMRPQETIKLLEATAKGKSGLNELSAKVASDDATIDDRFAFADAAIRRGKYADALRELTVSLDRASAPAANADGRNLRVVLARLVDLGNVEPAALELVKARRDAMEKTLSPHFPKPMLMVVAFNEALKQPEKNFQLYLRLPSGSPLRENLFPLIFAQLVAERRYQEAVNGADLESFVNNAYPKKAAMAPVAAEPSGENSTASHIDPYRQRVLALTSAATEALLGVGQLEKAKRIAGRAVETFGDKAFKTRLQQVAQRAGSPSAAEFTTWLETQSKTGNSR